MIFQEPLNEQDRSHQEATVDKINLDAGIRPLRRLHPTLKKCACGFVGPKREFYGHMDRRIKELGKDVWNEHGEVPLNEDEAP